MFSIREASLLADPISPVNNYAMRFLKVGSVKYGFITRIKTTYRNRHRHPLNDIKYRKQTYDV